MASKRRIDWKALWVTFDDWHDAASGRAESPWLGPDWDQQQRKIERLVEAQLRAGGKP